jgi:hypothetical protein
MINELNKRLSRIQKESDIQNLVYGLKGLEEYIKKEILITNNRIILIEGYINEDKRKRPLSAKRIQGTDGRMSTSISYKKLTPVDCISCFQNTGNFSDRIAFGKKY